MRRWLLYLVSLCQGCSGAGLISCICRPTFDRKRWLRSCNPGPERHGPTIIDAPSWSYFVCYLLKLLFAHSKTLRDLLWSNCLYNMSTASWRGRILLRILWAEAQHATRAIQVMRVSEAGLIVINKVDISTTVFKIQRSLHTYRVLCPILMILLIWRRKKRPSQIVLEVDLARGMLGP